MAFNKPAANNPPDYWCMNTGVDVGKTHRSWVDCKTYGFLMSGGSPKYQAYVRSLKVGYRVFAYLNGHGFVGLGRIVAEAVPWREFIPENQNLRLIDLPHAAMPESTDDPSTWDWCAAVRWVYKVDADGAVCQDRHRRATLRPIRDPLLVDRLFKELGQACP